MPDPDLKIRGRGGGGGGKARSSKKFFWSFGPQFGLKIRGRGGPPGHSPGSATAQHLLELWQRFAPLCTPLPVRTQQLQTLWGQQRSAALHWATDYADKLLLTYLSPNVGLGGWYVGIFPQNPILIRVIYLRINTLVWLIMQYGPRTRKYMNLKL